MNQEQALLGQEALLRGEPISEIPDHQIERFLMCGNCVRCELGLQTREGCEILRREFQGVVERLENFDWYRDDPEVREERKLRYHKRKWQREKLRKLIRCQTAVAE